MRDILFKAKRIDNGEWIEGYYVKNSKEKTQFNSVIFTNIDSMLPECFDFYEIDESTLCQYTGLTDKNGNKIWENDAVRDKADDMTMVVRWDEEKLRFVLDDYGYSGCLMEYGYDETAGRFGVVDTYGFDDFYNPDQFFEVIGNIFDNADLLEG